MSSKKIMKKSLLLLGIMAIMMFAMSITSMASGEVIQTGETGTSVTIKWNATGNEAATEYHIYVGEDYSSTSSATPIVVPITQTSYTIPNLTAGKEYYVLVKYQYKSSYSDSTYESSVGSTYVYTKIKAVSGLNQERWYYYIQSVDVKWDKVEGAYYDWVIKDNKNKKVASKSKTTSNSASSSVKNSKIYTVQVRQYFIANPGTSNEYKIYSGSSAKNSWSKPAYLFTQPMVKENKIKQKAGSLYVSWNKISGATSYTVYISTKEKKGYKKAGTVKSSKNSLTIKKYGSKKIAKGKKYYVYVVANKKVGKKTYTSGRLYTVDTKTKSLHWSF